MAIGDRKEESGTILYTPVSSNGSPALVSNSRSSYGPVPVTTRFGRAATSCSCGSWPVAIAVHGLNPVSQFAPKCRGISLVPGVTNSRESRSSIDKDQSLQLITRSTVEAVESELRGMSHILIPSCTGDICRYRLQAKRPYEDSYGLARRMGMPHHTLEASSACGATSGCSTRRA